MTLKNFLTKIDPAVKIKVWDTEKKSGNIYTVGSAEELTKHYKFSYHLIVEDFMVTPDCVTVTVKRG